MKFKIILMFFMSLYLKSYGQLNLEPVFNPNTQDSIIARYYYLEDKVPDEFKGPKPEGNWKVYSINEFSFNSFKDFEFEDSKFLDNLIYPDFFYMSIDTGESIQQNIFGFPKLADDEEFLPGDFRPYLPGFINDLKFLGRKFDLRKIGLFKLESLPELYLFWDGKLYIIKDQQLCLAMPLLKKKYKSKERFLRLFKVF